MRDDFLSDVKRTLAARAGHGCSLCFKTTSGPGADPDLALSDGVAAHITAASPGGPRFDPSLTPEQRRGAENGIWVCTQHGREIDADTSPFSVEVLRGLKRIREENAQRELQGSSDVENRSALLIEFPYVETTYKLFEVINAQAYTYPTTSALRDLLRRSGAASSRLLDLAAEVIPGISGTHPNVAGILSTLLSSNFDLWHPTPAVLSKLEQICHGAVVAGDWTRVALIEPLAFAAAAKGRPDAHRQVLDRLIDDRHWRGPTPLATWSTMEL